MILSNFGFAICSCLTPVGRDSCRAVTLFRALAARSVPLSICPPSTQNDPERNPLRPLAYSAGIILVLLVSALCVLPPAVSAASFSGTARLEVTDSTGGLSWNGTALSVSCWFKISIPTGTGLTENMVILANRRSGSETDSHAFLIQFNIFSGNVEFSTKGANGTFTSTLIERPYLDRWYHVAVIRQSEAFTGYVDGRQVFSSTGSVGDAKSTDGLSIGGWGGGKYLFGEVQEVAVYQTPLSQEFIVTYIFQNQPTNDPSLNLKGYFKLGYSANAADNLKNFAPTPVPSGTEFALKQGSGQVDFEEANQAGEQSAFDSRKNGGRDALAPLSGAFSWEQTALSRPTPGVAFDFRFGYSSANAFGGFKLGGIDPYASGPLGNGWRHIFETRVIPAQTFSPLADTDTVGLMTWDGLVISGANCQWTTPERLVYVFRRPDSGDAVMRGRLTSIHDFNGNAVQIHYEEILGQITRVIDTAGGRYDFFHTNGILQRITFGDWSMNMTYDATNRLVSRSVTNSSGLYAPVNTTWQFAYGTNGLLERVIDPRGNTNISVVFDKYGRRIEQRDALNRLTRTEYGVPGKRQVKNTDAENNAWIETYDRKHRLLSRKDPLGNETQTTYDEAGNPATITEPLGWQTFMAYDNRGNITNIIDALTNVSRRVIHPVFNKGVQEIDPLGWTNFIVIDDTTGNLLRNHDALGNLATYTYLSNGLVETFTDGNGRTTRFAYNTNGFLSAQTDAASNTTYFAVNELGWRLAQTNARGEVTTFAYDLNGNAVRMVDPLQRVFIKTYDANGNVLSESDAKGRFSFYGYDVANQRVAMTNRADNVWTYTYTARGQPLTSTDPLGFTSTNSYDAANRLVAVSDALGNTISNRYDANGKITNMIDQVGQIWIKTYDQLGRVIAETDPQGDTRRTIFDAANRVKEIITPKGYASTHEYDGRARLTQWTDAEGFVWRYDYDGIQNITNITDALGGHYVMAYGPRNERTLERNQDGFEWHYTYDALLRLKQQTDPNGTTRTLEYDPGGRVLSVAFNTGRVNTFTYDENNNPELLARIGSGPPTVTSFKYDALDRVVESTDAFGRKVLFGYDPRGLRTTLTYPDNKVLTNRFDAIGRLTNQMDWAGRPMTYAYDKAGRLTRRTYPNGVVQTNAFDTTGQLTGLSYSPPNPQPATISIALSYAYDKNGNKVGSTETGTLNWPLPTLTDEKADYTKSGRLKTRTVERLPPPGGEGQGEGGPFHQPTTLNYSYDGSGNMTNATGNGQSWSLTYDEDNRTTSIHWDSGLTAKHIVNRYDALGRRVARTLDGLETRYVLDLAGGMERILCDMNAAGAIDAWYVHGPDLAYKVDAANNVTCYHADAQANIIALTDGTTNTLAQYAYTPYGRVLGSTNLQPSAFSPQPFLFVGSQGVMEELPGLYFMRARYYSADAAVFLSTEPIKKIGPGWKPAAYAYTEGNPLTYTDPSGLFPEGLGVMKPFGSPALHVNSGLSPEDLGTLKAESSETPLDPIAEAFGEQIGKWLAGGGPEDPDDPIRKGLKYGLNQIRKGKWGLKKMGKQPLGQVATEDLPNRLGENLPNLAKRVRDALSPPKSAAATTRTFMASRAPSAGIYAMTRNAVQGAVGKLASGAISLAAPFVGSFAADAFGRILPKSTPPVVREAVKFAVSAAVTSVVQAAAPYIGAAVGAVAGVAVAATSAVAAGAAKVIVAIVIAIGIPKRLILLLMMLIAAAGIQYCRHLRWRRLYQSTNGQLAFQPGL